MSPTAPQITAGIRQAALILGSILGTLGFASLADKFGVIATLAPQIAGLVLLIAPAVVGAATWFGQLHTRREAQKAAALTVLVPNEVAKFK
jgi:hypothetical protein